MWCSGTSSQSARARTREGRRAPVGDGASRPAPRPAGSNSRPPLAAAQRPADLLLELVEACTEFQPGAQKLGTQRRRRLRRLEALQREGERRSRGRRRARLEAR